MVKAICTKHAIVRNILFIESIQDHLQFREDTDSSESTIQASDYYA